MHFDTRNVAFMKERNRPHRLDLDTHWLPLGSGTILFKLKKNSDIAKTKKIIIIIFYLVTLIEENLDY